MARKRGGMIWAITGLCAIGLVLILFGVALSILGGKLPVTHTASSFVVVGKSVDGVWGLITDFEGMKRWPRSGITGVERLADEGGLPVVRQRMGRNSFVLRTTKMDAPRELQRTISDDHQYFGGSWTYVLTPEGGGCRVTLTEVGTVKGALPRAVMHYFFGEEFYLKKHLAALKAAAER